jgi:hypothetical protein
MAAVDSSGRRSRREWQSLIERAERSPLSVTAFCATQGVSTASFYLWRKRLSAEVELPAEFLDLGELQAPVEPRAERSDGWELELALGGGLVLHLRRR